MRKISLWALIFIFTAFAARAQDTATQQQLDKLSGQIQDLLEAQAQNGKRMDALEREIRDLRDKVNTPPPTDSASRDDLKALAEKIQEVDRKRIEDNQHVYEQIKLLGKVVAAAPAPGAHKPSPKPPADDTAPPAVPQKGYDYVVKPGDTLALIAQAYRDQGVKVTRAQIRAANPKINFDVLLPGKKIFIPDANAK
jgi:septal ring factor EnvC (AmiA/AmiB activator)